MRASGQRFGALRPASVRFSSTSEVLRPVSRFQTDVEPVFDAIAARALDLGRATTGWVYRFDGELIHIVAAHSLRPEAVDVVRQSYPMPASRGGGTARAVLSRNVVYIPEIRVAGGRSAPGPDPGGRAEGQAGAVEPSVQRAEVHPGRRGQHCGRPVNPH
jgi:hypothetical protein